VTPQFGALNEIDTFIRQRCIELIKIDMIENISISNNGCCSNICWSM